MILLPTPVMDEISRYLDYAWEWKTICKIINFRHGYDFEIFELERIYRDNHQRFRELKALKAQHWVSERGVSSAK